MKTLSFLILVTFFVSCRPKSQPIIASTKESQIVLIVDGLKKTESIILTKNGPFDIILPDLYYTNGNYEEVSIPIDYHKTRDTFVIASKTNNIILNYKVGPGKSIQYFTHLGDTLLLSNAAKPELKLINGRRLDQDLNYEVNYLASRPTMQMYNVSSLYRMMHVLDLVNKCFVSEPKAYSTELLRKLADEKSSLDSLKKIKEISPDCYNYYSDRNRYLALSIKIDLNQSVSDVIKTLKQVKKDTACFNYDYYMNFIEKAANKLYGDISPMLISRNGSFRDNRIVFNNLAKDTLFITQTKNILLEKQLINISENFSKEEFIKFFEKFKTITKDSSAITRIKQKFLLDYDALQQDVSNINVMNSEKKAQTFQEIKETNKGRVLYVDFWASWCVPCREQMPASTKLRKAYQGKKVDFIYLSTDSNYKNWINATDDEGLTQYPQSYLILNAQASKELLSLQIKSIPRYLIYNKRGELVNKNAPSPNSPQLKKMLDKYISEE